MILPFVKLGTLALRTLSKPIASKLKKQAGVHPSFRELIVNSAQALRRKGEDMAKEVELLKQKLSEIEKHSKGWGLSGILHLKETNAPVSSHPTTISS